MDFRCTRPIRIISLTVLFFFCWTFGGIFDIVAFAATDNKQAKNSNQLSASSSQSTQTSTPKPEEKFQKAIDDITQIVCDTSTDTDTKKNKLKTKRSEIEGLDTAIKKQFSDTERLLKEKGLPPEILERHYKFVKHYEDNLKELNDNLAAIDKSKTKSEADAAISRAKAHLEKVKAPSRHVPLDPNKLPHELQEYQKEELKISSANQDLLSSALGNIFNVATNFLFSPAYAAEISPTEKSANLAETLETPLSQEIVKFANELGDVPVDIFVPIRDDFKYEPYAGSLKGAVQTLKEKAGNEWDLASLLIALLRAKGIPARYVVGTIQMPIDQAMEWLGVEDPNMAATLLVSNGRPTALITGGGNIRAIETRHVWVQAFIPFTSSRGTTSGLGDRWVDIDPSYKPQKITQMQSLSGVPLFDQTEYLSTFQTVSPYEYYESQLQAFLDVNAPGFKPNAIMRETEIIPEISEVIVGQLPYVEQSVSGTYSEVPDSFRQKFTLTISDPDLGDVQLSYQAFLPQIIGKRLTLSYSPATASDQAVINAYGNIYATPSYLVYLKPVIKLDGAIVAEGIQVQTGIMQKLVFLFDSTIDVGRVENLIVAGEYYAIALNGQGNIERDHIQERIRQFQALEGGINLYDYSTLDEELGELLYLTAVAYHQNLSAAMQKLSALYKVIDIRKVSELMCFVNLKVEDIFGIPIKITLTGIGLDMDRDIHLVIPVDGDISRIKPYMQIEGNYSSYLEHAILEQVFQTEAISAVKAIQLANDQGIPIHTITWSNVNTELPLLQISSQTKTEIMNAVYAGKEALVPERNLTLYDWNGVGYILYDPAKGSAGYMISGGYGGGMVVRAVGILDHIESISPFYYGNNVNSIMRRQRICYPGKNQLWDVCYNVLTYEDLAGEGDECDSAEACKEMYKPVDKYGRFSMPLIDSQEEGKDDDTYLSNTVKVGAWKSSNNSGGKYRFMRAGRAIMVLLDLILSTTKISSLNAKTLDVSGGYRTYERAVYIKQHINRRASLTSNHIRGIAADYSLTDNTGKKISKCKILNLAYKIIGTNAEILSEGSNMPGAVHTATPTNPSTDKNQYPNDWKCEEL